MTITSTILRNIKLLTAAQIIASVAGLFSSALLARALGAEGFGIIGFGAAFLSLLGVAASLSTDMYGTREIARNVEQAASGTREVAVNIQGVTQAAGETGAAATQILTAAGGLEQESSILKTEVEKFLAEIRAG